MADVRMRVGFVGAVGALVVLYFVSGSPISLYSMWQDELGMTNSQLAMLSMWYLLGTVIPLLFLPRISNHIGRRPATVMILLISMSGAITFAMISSPEMIMAGRFIQGLASGFGSSTVAAYVVDLSAGLPKWVAPAITSSAPTLGLSTGAFVSGGLVGNGSISVSGYFETATLAIVVIIVLILIARETMSRSPGLFRSMVPQLGIPVGCGRLFAASCTIFIGTWVVGGFAQSFSASLVRDAFGHTDAFLSAVVVTCIMLPNVFGAFFANRFDVRTAQRWGMGLFTLFSVSMLVSLAVFDSLLLYCICSIMAAFTQGIAFTACVTELLYHATKVQRAGTFSTVYLVSYGGPAIFNLLVGMIPGEYPIVTILSWYVMCTVLMFVILLIMSAKPYPSAPIPEQD